jgi:Bacterial SH3 domain
MLRHVAAVAVAVCLSPVSLFAQNPVFTVNAASADVYKSPSTGSPVIGHAPHGAVLQVTRELGSWVKVSWLPAPDGVGYVHMTMGAIVRRPTVEQTRASAAPAARPQPAATGRSTARPEPAPVPLQTPPTVHPVYVTPASHVVGLGASVGGSTIGVGASARAWRRDRLGVQFAMTRYSLTSSVTSQRVTSMQFGPSVLYALPNRVTDYFWLRPYVGSGVQMRHQTLGAVTASGDTIADNAFGVELTFAALPQFALSADVSYRRIAASFAGFESRRLGVAVSGHWYVR